MWTIKKTAIILSVLLAVVFLFSACSENTTDIVFVANKDIKDQFDKVHTVNYILDDIRKVDFYYKMTVDNTYTEKTEKDPETGKNVTRYYNEDVLIYTKFSDSEFEYYTLSTHSNDMTIRYTDKNGKRSAVKITCVDEKGTYSVTFDKGLDKNSPYGADNFTVWIEPMDENATFKSEVYYNVEYKDSVTTCTLTSAKYYDKDGTFKRFSHTTDEDGVTSESDEPLYTEADTEIIIGDSVDIIRHIEQQKIDVKCQLLMGKHSFSYAKNDKDEETDWYINSKIRFLFKDKKEAEAFSARYGGNGAKDSGIKETPYAVSFDSCNLKISPDCIFPDNKTFGEFAAEEWKKDQYMAITLGEDCSITCFGENAEKNNESSSSSDKNQQNEKETTESTTTEKSK